MSAYIGHEIDAIEQALSQEAKGDRQPVLGRALGWVYSNIVGSTSRWLLTTAIVYALLSGLLVSIGVPVLQAAAASIVASPVLTLVIGFIAFFGRAEASPALTAELHDGLRRIRYLVESGGEDCMSSRDRARLVGRLVKVTGPDAAAFHHRAGQQLVRILRMVAGAECLPALDQVAQGERRGPGMVRLRREVASVSALVRKRIAQDRSRAGLLRAAEAMDSGALLRRAAGSPNDLKVQALLLRPTDSTNHEGEMDSE